MTQDIEPENRPTLGQSAIEGVAEILSQVASTIPDSALPELLSGRRLHQQGIPELDRYVISPEKQWAAIYNTVSETFRTWFDEATRVNWTDALACRRDAFIDKLMTRRKLPVASLDWELEPDDTENPYQIAVAEEVTRLVKATPRFYDLRNSLLEAIFFGKAGVQVVYTRKMVNGVSRVVVKKHVPLQGDKIVWKWDGTPGIFVFPDYRPFGKSELIQLADRGMALFLTDAADRDQFVIHTFEPRDTDFQYEADMAAAIYGIGMRSRVYHQWWIRTEVLSWAMNALQRLSVNGMLIGFYQSGDMADRQAVIQAVKDVVDFNVGVMPKQPGQGDPQSNIHHIEASAAAYPVFDQWVQYFDSIIEYDILGINEQSMVMGAGGARTESAIEYSGNVEAIRIRSDATSLDETITDQLLGPLIRLNHWRYGDQVLSGYELPFQIRFKSILETPNMLERLQAGQLIVGMGGTLAEADVLKLGGFKSPKKDDEALGVRAQRIMAAVQQQQMQQQQQMMGGGMMPGGQGAPAQAGGEAAYPASGGNGAGAAGGGMALGGQAPRRGTAPGPNATGGVLSRPPTYARQGEGAPPPVVERQRHERVRYAATTWDKTKHPRGQPENAGEFAPRQGGTTGKGAQPKAEPKAPTKPASTQESRPTATSMTATAKPPKPKADRDAGTPLFRPGKGAPISKAVRYYLDAHFPFSDEVKQTYQIMDHLMSDGDLYPIVIGSAPPGTSAAGATVFDNDDNVVGIMFSTKMDYPLLTVAHESGHWLDAVGIPGGRTEMGKNRDYDHDEHFKGVFAALKASQAYKSLHQARRDLQAEGRGGQDDLGGFVDYLLAPHEVWARAYAQWVATRSRDRDMMKDLNVYRAWKPEPGAGNPDLADQWQDEDFAPIGKAIDAMFTKLGWIKKP
jgi:hypothetical protein